MRQWGRVGDRRLPTISAMEKTLNLIIPGLLEPWPESNQPGFPKPQAPALERLLSRAVVKDLKITGADATLFELFGVGIPPDRDLPVAPVTRLTDAGDAADGWWLRADPVHLRADLHQVLLFDARALDIGAAEARSLAEEFNRTFAADGYTLEAPHPTRWYLRLENDPGIRTHHLMEVIGRDVRPLLPYGPSAARWHTLLTEVQMLFHRADVNIERESRGQLPINSVWFWGGGELSRGVHSPAEAIFTRDPLVRGLARLAGRAVNFLPATAGDWQAAAATEPDGLVVLEATRYDRADDELQVWVDHVNMLDRDWFAPCLALLQARELATLVIHPGNGRSYTINSRDLSRFWRRVRPLSYHLQ